MSARVLIVDYQSGNLASITKSLDRLGYEYIVSGEPAQIAAADKLILPGVGHFGAAMQQLSQLRLINALTEAARARKVPVLGICLGMQLMAGRSEEGDCEGLGWFEAEVVRLCVSDSLRFKVPHTGWNHIRPQGKHPLLQDLTEEDEFYFLHGYCWLTSCPDQVLASTSYGAEFPAVVGRDNLMGVQFHPEKSHQSGRRLLRNFLEL